MERRQPGSDDTRERIQGYLDRSGLAAVNTRVVPLTGDASDRRYFRILLADAPSIVLALNSAPFDVTKLPLVNTLLSIGVRCLKKKWYDQLLSNNLWRHTHQYTIVM